MLTIIVLHNYSPDYLCSHGERVWGNIYLCWFIPDISATPRDLVPQTQCYLTNILHFKKIEAGQFSVPRTENSGIILSLDSVPRAFRGLTYTLQLRKRIQSWTWPGKNDSQSVCFSCPQPQACMNIYLLGEESHCRLMYCCIYHIWEKNVPAFTEGHLNISPFWKIRNFQVFYMDLLGMCLSLSWVVESLQFLLPLNNVQDPNTPGCIGSFRWLKLVSVEQLRVHCIAQVPKRLAST